MAARARDLLRAAADLTEAANAPREPLAGPLRLAIIPTIAPFMLPRLFAVSAERWPRLRLQAREMLTSAACEALQRNTVDCVMLALPAACGDVTLRPICDDELLFAAGAEHKRSGAASVGVSASELLLLDEGHCLREHALTACDLAEVATDTPLVATSLQTLVAMVDAGLGATFLPRMAVKAGVLKGTRVVTSPFRPPMHRAIALAWRKHSPLAGDLHLLATTIADVVVEASEPQSRAQA